MGSAREESGSTFLQKSKSLLSSKQPPELKDPIVAVATFDTLHRDYARQKGVAVEVGALTRYLR